MEDIALRWMNKEEKEQSKKNRKKVKKEKKRFSFKIKWKRCWNEAWSHPFTHLTKLPASKDYIYKSLNNKTDKLLLLKIIVIYSKYFIVVFNYWQSQGNWIVLEKNYRGSKDDCLSVTKTYNDQKNLQITSLVNTN